MATIRFLNQALSTSVVNNTSAALTDLYFVIWKLSRAMKKAGWTYKASSDGSTKDTSGTASNDKWGGNVDPAADTYNGFNGSSAWWNAQGPSTLKIPISGPSTGTFIRGEDGYQASSGAHGEILGYIWDIPTSQGYLVIAPRIDGYGSDPHGWDHTGSILGNLSAATATPSATVIEFFREVVFWKSNFSGDQTPGNIYYQCMDGYAEATLRFSYMATNSAGCTGAVAPGGGGTNNFFPASGSMVVVGGTPNNVSTTSVGSQTLPVGTFNVVSTVGFPSAGGFAVGATNVYYTGTNSTQFTGCTGGSGTVTNGSTITSAMGWPRRWTNHSSGVGQNQCHVVALNSIYSSNVTADGSFWVAIGSPAVLATDNGAYDGFMFSIVDNAEPGDVDPYVWYMPAADNYTSSPTSILSAASKAYCAVTTNGGLVWRMLRRRGMPTGDGFTNASSALLVIGQGGSNQMAISTNVADRETLACTFNTTYLAEDIWVISVQAYSRIRKGVVRWMKAVTEGGNAAGTDTFGALSWVQLQNVTGAGGTPPFIAGPWDGVTIPIGTH